MRINAEGMHFKTLNEQVRFDNDGETVIDNCIGQRYIASGMQDKRIKINGIPGNALGSYLNGCVISVNGNAQDATGDTMNDGVICIYGSVGDATGYAMRGGKIFVEKNAGYRAGIHMKQYQEKKPILVIGGQAGNFLGEYQAGGVIIVLGLNCDGQIPVGQFCATGMHGGKIYIRGNKLPADLPEKVVAQKATEADMQEIDEEISEFCQLFDIDKSFVLSKPFYVLTPDTKNPYKQLYTYN